MPSFSVSIGLDPGPRRTAWAVSTKSKGQCYMDAWGVVDSTPQAISQVLQEHQDASPLVVVEQIFITPGGNNNAIRDTCQVGGGIAWLAEMMDLKVLLVTSTKWRRLLCFSHRGQTTPGDKDVAIALNAIYGKTLPHRSNTHLRDALGIATYGNLS